MTGFTVDGTSYSAGDTASLTEGDLTINTDGSYTFTPAADYNGPVPVATYTVSDGNGGTDTATLTLAVNAVNDAKPLSLAFPENSESTRAEQEYDAAAGELSAEGMVLDAVDEIRDLENRDIHLDAEGIVLTTVDKIYALNGTKSLSSESAAESSPIKDVSTLKWLADTADQAFGTAFSTSDVQALVGYSIRMDIAGTATAGDSVQDAQIVVDTLLRDQVIFVEIGSTLELKSDHHIVNYSILQADGRPLPNWINQAGNGLLLVEPPANGGEIDLMIIAEHANGSTTIKAVTIQLETGQVNHLQQDYLPHGSMFQDQLAKIHKEL